MSIYGQTVDVDNFGKVDERIYRGAQPSEKGLIELKALGINTIIDLRDDPQPFEKKTVETLGMSYINIPMSGYLYPREKDIQKLLSLLNDVKLGHIFIHCKAGIHRTGTVVAVYEMHNYKFKYSQVKQEMHDHQWFGFSQIWHIRLRKYAKDYAKKYGLYDKG
jgi:protein-tyrosine phosphatase